MQVVRMNSAPGAGAPLPACQPVEGPAETTLEGGANDHGLECGQMPTFAGLRDVFHRRM